jgi:heme exporter protein B
MPRSPFLSACAAVLRRDALEELRRRVSVAAVLFFAAATLALISFSIGSVSLPPSDRARLNAGLLWILLFFSASTGLPRSYVREEETGSALALRKIAAGETVLAGKFLFNYVLFLLIAAAASPLFCLLLDWHLENPGAFAAVLTLAGFGLAFVSTFLSAIISRAGQKNVLFALTAFPLVLPLLLPAVLATALAASDPAAALGSEFRLLVSYDGVAACAGFLLIRFVWEG